MPQECGLTLNLRCRGGSPYAVTGRLGQLVPSRWKGQRCIDWVLANLTRTQVLTYDPLTWSDHKADLLELGVSHQGADEGKIFPKKKFEKPSAYTAEEWSRMLEVAWSNHDPVLHQNNSDKDWAVFNDHLVAMYQQGYTAAGCPVD